MKLFTYQKIKYEFRIQLIKIDKKLLKKLQQCSKNQNLLSKMCELYNEIKLNLNCLKGLIMIQETTDPLNGQMGI